MSRTAGKSFIVAEQAHEIKEMASREALKAELSRLAAFAFGVALQI
jgi:hypothetical protein